MFESLVLVTNLKIIKSGIQHGYKSGTQHGYHATVRMPGCKSNQGS